MSGTLYAIGVGPGEPELLTLKAVRIIREVPCLCVPKGKEEGTSLALDIVSKVLSLEGKEIVEAYFPMKKTKSSEHYETLDTRWNTTVEEIVTRLKRGIDIAFLTIGDPTIYSTFFYLHDRLLELNPQQRIIIVPGVSSINACASRIATSLGLADEKIAIIPATYIEELKDILITFDTVVLMKVHKVIDKIISILKELDLLKKSIYVAKVGMEDEAVYYDITKIRDKDLNYFSIMIVKK
ncbi:MAG: precorrin-2 C(20)-methyltransferase [Thermodesulfovibrionales bacterium]|nr:precorrin-2 C(20)-methyltransferase [Thermodesulfovibrionales bacterium]